MSGNYPNNNNPFGNPPPTRVPPAVLCTPQQYEENMRQLQQLADANRVGLQNYITVQDTLSRRIAEGEQARQQLQWLQQMMNARPAIGPPQASTNRVTSLPNPSANVAAYQAHPAVPAATFVNGNSAFRMNAPGAYIVNPSPLAAPSSSQQAFRMQPPVSSSSTASVENISQPVRQQTTMSNTNREVPLAHSFRTSYSNNQAFPPISASYTQNQGYPNVSTNAAPGPSKQQGRLDTHEATSYRVPVSGPSSSFGLGQGVSSSGTRIDVNYQSSDSSLAGALGETSTTGVTGMIPQTATGKQRHTAAKEAPSHISPTSSVSVDNAQMPDSLSSQIGTGAASTTLASLSDERRRRAQQEIESITRNQPENNTGSLSKHSHFATHPDSSSMSTQPTQNVTSVPSGGSASIPLSNRFQVPGVNATQESRLPFSGVVHSGESRSTFAPVLQNTVPVSRPRWAGLNIPNTIQSHQPMQDYYSASVAAQGAQNGIAIVQTQIPTAQEHLKSHQTNANRSSTPPPDENRPPGPITPASANKKTLAKDILWALNRTPEKRKASTSESSVSDADLKPPPLKRQETEPQPTDMPVMIADVFTIPSMLPVGAHADDSARIEEVEDDNDHGVGFEDAPVMMEGGSPEVSYVEPARIEQVGDDKHEGIGAVHDQGGSPEVRNLVLVPLDAMTSDVPTVPDSLPPYPAIESRASSEAEFGTDTALRPAETPSVPLFLPSRESSPTPFTPKRKKSRKHTPAASSSSTPVDPMHRPRRRLEVFVEVPVLTEAQRKLFYLKEDSKNAPSTNMAARNAVNQTDVVDEGRRRAAHEAAVIAASRIRRRPCFWNGCSQVSNSANSLRFHVLEHVESIPDKEKIFLCWWGECLRKFNKREALAQHLRNHVGRCIFCSYQGCEAAFGNSLDLLAHVETDHHPGDTLRPTVQPFVPALRPAPPLGTMFAYHVVNLPIQMAAISPERRARLGPWVAKNCFGSVNLGALRLHTRNQLLRRRGNEAEPKLLGDWQDRYDFLESWPTTYPPNCANLESVKASEEIERGLVLLPDRAGPQGQPREQRFTSQADRVKLPHPEQYEIKPEFKPEGHENEVSEIKVEISSPVVPQVQHPRSVSEGPLDSYPDFLGLGDSPPTIMSPA